MKIEKILFRANSSSKIGIGHIMRDLILAEQFKDANIIFATQNLPGNIIHEIEEHKYKIEILKSNDLKEVIKLIHKYSIDMIVIDNYDIDDIYEKELKDKTGVKIFVLDDTYEKHFCEILLNHNIYAEKEKYHGLVPKYCELRCGAKYTLLRQEFIEEKKKKVIRKEKSEIKTVFIAMGGADHSNINIKILEVLKEFENIKAIVVTTTANNKLEKLQNYCFDKDWINLQINSNEIAHLMKVSDFALVSPSVTMNEVLYLNLPFIAIKTAENQNNMYNYLLKNNNLVLKEYNKNTLNKMIQELICEDNIKLKNFIDLSLHEKEIILKWRNNPDNRKWMYRQDKIELNEHLGYIESLKYKSDRLYFLVEKSKQDIGVIDFKNIDKENRSTEFGIYTNPNVKHIGKILMKVICDFGFNNLMMNKLIAEVFSDNIRAIKLYKKFGFVEFEHKQVNNKAVIRMELKK